MYKKLFLLILTAMLFTACNKNEIDNDGDMPMEEEIIAENNDPLQDALNNLIISPLPSPPGQSGPVEIPVRERLPRPAREFSDNQNAAALPAPRTYLAADAAIHGSLEILSDNSVGWFRQDDMSDCLEFSVDIEYEGFYRLEFITRADSFKENYVYVNGSPSGNIVTTERDFAPSFVNRVYLEVGTHSVEIKTHWGWFTVLSLTVHAEPPLDESIYIVPIELINPNADDNALGLMSFLAMNYGLYSLAGQQSQGNWRTNHGLFGGEANFIYEITGRRPAVIGLDMIDYSLSRVANGAFSREVEAAIEAWENNAIVTFCWHWNAPTPYITGEWHRAFYTQNSQRGFFKRIMDGDDPEGFQLLMDDIDAIAVQLKRLQDAGVPVLWRPLHEASGGWFWWGTDRDSYLQLWEIMYDRLTNEHGLNNLIWVWNGQHPDWYPGDHLVDIIGEDIYAEPHDHSSQANMFFTVASYSDAPRMVVLSENGVLFDPELAMRDGAMWGYWCVWNGDFARTEEYTSFETLRQIYNSEYVLTHEDLPDLRTFPIYYD